MAVEGGPAAFLSYVAYGACGRREQWSETGQLEPFRSDAQISPKQSLAGERETRLYYGWTSIRRRGDSVITRRSVLLAGGIGLFVAHPLSRGQAPSKTPRIGVLWFGSMDTPAASLYGHILGCIERLAWHLTSLRDEASRARRRVAPGAT